MAETTVFSVSDSVRPERLAQSAELRHDWDEQYGDKMIKIVFIGQNLDREALKAELDKI